MDSTSGQTLSYSATGLPAGVLHLPDQRSLNRTPTTAGTSTVTVSAQDGNGARASASFTWTVVPAAALPATPLVGYNGLYLDLSGDGNANGSAVDVYTCNGTNGQEWTEEANGSVQAGNCLDVTSGGTANGTWSSSTPAMAAGRRSGSRSPTGAAQSAVRALPDRPRLSTNPGTQTQIQACNGASDQVWKSPAGTTSGGGGTTGTGAVTGYQGLCLDVNGANTANGTKVDIYTCNGTNAQQWTVESNSTLQALGKCLDVVGGGTANGSLVDLYACNGTGAQVWQPGANGSLVNPQSAPASTTPAATTPGTQVQIWSCTGSANQSWTLP